MIYFSRHTRKKIRTIKEKIFRICGISALSIAFFMMIFLLFSIFSKGYTAFFNHTFELNVIFNQDVMFDEYNQNDYDNAYIDEIVNYSLIQLLKQQNITDIDEEQIYKIYSQNSLINIYNYIKQNKHKIINTSHKFNILVSSDTDMLLKGYLSEGEVLSQTTIQSIKVLEEKKIIVSSFNKYFFTRPDSRYPEIAGILVALVGSAFTIFLTVIFSVVFSIGAAVYLEEFAKKNMVFKLIEVNINNLAAVPSIIFGLLGLIIFEQTLGLPRSSSLLASLVLTLMALPTIIITSRIALSTVPLSVKEAAYGVGSSKVQVVWYHVLPIALPGIITGIVLSISRIIGETAPLLMIGMVAFIHTVPTSPLDNALVFPVQILLWSDSPELGYIEKASAAIMLLVLFLILMNWLSIYLRNKFSTKL